MTVYGDLVILLNFLVDFLLLLGTNRLSGHPPGVKRAALASALGSVYAMACLLPGFRFLGNVLWRAVSLGGMGVITFGFQPSALRRSVLFLLLSMAMGGMALGVWQGGFPALVVSAGGLWLLCRWGFRGVPPGQQLIRLTLCHGGHRLELTALRDTGNTLRDPITGESVIVIGPKAAALLTGLTLRQLEHPVETVATGPKGLRLVPYRTVGNGAGMLLAMKMEVETQGHRGRRLVAFAPQGLDREQAYQALTGG